MRILKISMAVLALTAVSSYGAITEVEANNTFATAQGIPVGTYVPDGGFAVDGFLGAGDVDYYSVFLNAGDYIGVAIFDFTPGDSDSGGINDNDSYLGIFDPGGGLFEVDDDDGPGFLSATHIFIPVAGLWRIAVTGFGDPNFDGIGHDESFRYLLDFSHVPEPTTIGLLLAGAALLRRRR